MCFEDYDLLYTLDKKIGREAVVDLLRENSVESFTEYPKDALWHTEFIEKIKKLIVSRGD